MPNPMCASDSGEPWPMQATCGDPSSMPAIAHASHQPCKPWSMQAMVHAIHSQGCTGRTVFWPGHCPFTQRPCNAHEQCHEQCSSLQTVALASARVPAGAPHARHAAAAAAAATHAHAHVLQVWGGSARPAHWKSSRRPARRRAARRGRGTRIRREAAAAATVADAEAGKRGSSATARGDGRGRRASGRLRACVLGSSDDSVGGLSLLRRAGPVAAARRAHSARGRGGRRTLGPVCRTDGSPLGLWQGWDARLQRLIVIGGSHTTTPTWQVTAPARRGGLPTLPCAPAGRSASPPVKSSGRPQPKLQAVFKEGEAAASSMAGAHASTREWTTHLHTWHMVRALQLWRAKKQRRVSPRVCGTEGALPRVCGTRGGGPCRVSVATGGLAAGTGGALPRVCGTGGPCRVSVATGGALPRVCGTGGPCRVSVATAGALPRVSGTGGALPRVSGNRGRPCRVSVAPGGPCRVSVAPGGALPRVSGNRGGLAACLWHRGGLAACQWQPGGLAACLWHPASLSACVWDLGRRAAHRTGTSASAGMARVWTSPPAACPVSALLIKGEEHLQQQAMTFQKWPVNQGWTLQNRPACARVKCGWVKGGHRSTAASPSHEKTAASPSHEKTAASPSQEKTAASPMNRRQVPCPWTKDTCSLMLCLALGLTESGLTLGQTEGCAAARTSPSGQY
eukprot:364538-Chlamydomonas_euryale.AAC.1